VAACVFFIYRMGTLFRITPLEGDIAPAGAPEGVQAFECFGALFFGAVSKIEALPAQLRPDTRAVVLDMHRLISLDTSGLDALEQLHAALHREDRRLVLAALNPQPLGLIERSGFAAVLGEAGVAESLAQALQSLKA
jgi:SulP family sulfate permease